MTLETDLTFFIKINSKWITSLNIKCKTIKLLGDSIGENLHDLGFADAFVDTTPKTQFTKEIIDKLDFIKIKNFCSAKNNIKRMRRQTTHWRKYLQKTHLIKNCYPKHTKNSKLNS